MNKSETIERVRKPRNAKQSNLQATIDSDVTVFVTLVHCGRFNVLGLKLTKARFRGRTTGVAASI